MILTILKWGIISDFKLGNKNADSSDGIPKTPQLINDWGEIWMGNPHSTHSFLNKRKVFFRVLQVCFDFIWIHSHLLFCKDSQTYHVLVLFLYCILRMDFWR